MTALGAKKHDATGRTVGRRKTNKRTQIGGQFAPRLIEMLHSPAYRVLSLSEHRCLSRIEIELAAHGGADNGRLPCTFDDFEAYGVRRHSVAPSLRALAALGFIEITEEGRAGNAEWRRPTLFRLTYRNTASAGETNEWRRIETVEHGDAIAQAARRASKKQKSSVRNGTKARCRNGTTKQPIHSDETHTTRLSDETHTTFEISGGVRLCGGRVAVGAAADGEALRARLRQHLERSPAGEHQRLACLAGIAASNLTRWLQTNKGIGADKRAALARALDEAEAAARAYWTAPVAGAQS